MSLAVNGILHLLWWIALSNGSILSTSLAGKKKKGIVA